MPILPAAFARLLGVLAVLLLLQPSADAAARIERVVSPGGIEAWLVRETATPLVAIEFAFRGAGNAQDPAGREGTANLVAAMLDEGAAEFDARGFQERLQALAMQLSFSASRDTFSGSMRTLTANRDAAFEMLHLALTEPRFDGTELERVRAAALAGLRREQTQPNTIVSRAFSAAVFPNHPYSRPPNGTPESVAAITRDDLAAFRRRLLARDGLVVAVVGDIDAATLGPLLDRTFGALPARAEQQPVAAIVPVAAGTRRIVDIEGPQSVIQFGLPGIDRRDPDFIAASVMNHIFGGGSFTSRLWQEVRERRGLTYGISTGLASFERAALFVGSTSTRNDRVAETLGIIEAEFRRMAESGPTEDELAKAKAYLTGSYLLRFDTSPRIAQQLLAIQLDELGIDWIDRRNAVVERISLEDVRRVARRLLSGELVVVIGGRPTGVSERRPGG